MELRKPVNDIGNAIKPYYGDAAGEKLSELPRDHILVATGVVKAAKAGSVRIRTGHRSMEEML